MEKSEGITIPKEVLTRWAESCVHLQHHGTLIQRELKPTMENRRAADLAGRIQGRAGAMFNELIEFGAEKPPGYAEAEK